MLQIPKNVMQIGEINPHTKIYMEDYVHTFLERRKKAEIYLAFGKKEDIGDVSYYMIYGVEKKTDWDRGSFPYFKKQERIGTIEGTANNWVLKPVRGSGILMDGYFIFYEQNEDMQSYMITVRENEDIAGSEENEEVMEAVRTHREQQKKETEGNPDAPVYRRDADGTSMEPAIEGRRESTAGTRKTFRQSSVKGQKSFERRSVQKRAVRPKRQEVLTEKKHNFTIADLCRAGSLVLLLVLVVTGLTSLNHYPDMKAVTELFSNAAKAVGMEKEDAVEAGAKPQDSSLIVEEVTAGGEETAAVVEATQDIPDLSDGGEDLVLAQEGGQIQWTIGQSTPQSQESPIAGESAMQPENAGEPQTADASGPVGQNKAEAVPEPDNASQAEESVQETAVSEEATQAIARPVTYVVKKGDSLAGIARKFYGTSSKVKEICSVNGIEDPDQIHPGQNILLP